MKDRRKEEKEVTLFEYALEEELEAQREENKGID